MFTNKIVTSLVLACAAAVGAPALAAEGTQDDFAVMFKMPMIDKNKDGMVSRQEFIAMMEKAYDMKAKAMAAKGGMMTEAQVQTFLKSLYTGG